MLDRVMEKEKAWLEAIDVIKRQAGRLIRAKESMNENDGLPLIIKCD